MIILRRRIHFFYKQSLRFSGTTFDNKPSIMYRPSQMVFFSKLVSMR